LENKKKDMSDKSNQAIEIVKEWDDDLIWCPSQCYLGLTYMGVKYVIYLRWRYTNPWTAELIQTDKSFCPNAIPNVEWANILNPDEYFTDDLSELPKLKQTAINNAKKYLYSGSIK
jgi:hypothetical protein